jgi:hypothetical protein
MNQFQVLSLLLVSVALSVSFTGCGLGGGNQAKKTVLAVEAAFTECLNGRSTTKTSSTGNGNFIDEILKTTSTTTFSNRDRTATFVTTISLAGAGLEMLGSGQAKVMGRLTLQGYRAHGIELNGVVEVVWSQSQGVVGVSFNGRTSVNGTAGKIHLTYRIEGDERLFEDGYIEIGDKVYNALEL